MTIDTLKQAAQALRDTKPELAVALEEMANQPILGYVAMIRYGNTPINYSYLSRITTEHQAKICAAKWQQDYRSDSYCQVSTQAVYASPITTPEYDAKERNAALQTLFREMEIAGIDPKSTGNEHG